LLETVFKISVELSDLAIRVVACHAHWILPGHIMTTHAAFHIPSCFLRMDPSARPLADGGESRHVVRRRLEKGLIDVPARFMTFDAEFTGFVARRAFGGTRFRVNGMRQTVIEIVYALN
jgi:hypothetical protein